MHPKLGTWPEISGMCPNWELNQRPFGLQARAQSTELHQPGLFLIFKKYVIWLERDMDSLPPIHAPGGCQSCNLAMFPDQESNPQHIGLQDNAPTNWATPARAVFNF